MARRKPALRGRAEGAAGLQRLWAPWRRSYVQAAAGSRPLKCIFCLGRAGSAALRERLVLSSTPLLTVMLNRYPYNSGHLMIAPRRHVASPELLNSKEQSALAAMIAVAVANLRRAYRPDGINLGANLGRAAGAGFAAHMHWHLVPRWEGDTNFMTVAAGTRVLTEMLEESFARLAPLFKTGRQPIS
jgi:ATP adenylyltransferase